MQKSFWWWRCSDRYIISLPPPPYPLPPSPLPVPKWSGGTVSVWTLSAAISLSLSQHGMPVSVSWRQTSLELAEAGNIPALPKYRGGVATPAEWVTESRSVLTVHWSVTRSGRPACQVTKTTRPSGRKMEELVSWTADLVQSHCLRLNNPRTSNLIQPLVLTEWPAWTWLSWPDWLWLITQADADRPDSSQ